MHKVAHLQVVVDVKAVWGIFDNTNGLYLQVNTLLVIYKSRYYSINAFVIGTYEINLIRKVKPNSLFFKCCNPTLKFSGRDENVSKMDVDSVNQDVNQ